jgi:hypothetical protein
VGGDVIFYSGLIICGYFGWYYSMSGENIGGIILGAGSGGGPLALSAIEDYSLL